MIFRYFDAEGRQLTLEQLRTMGLSDPVIDHVFATVLERVENRGNPGEWIETGPSG